MFRVDPKSGSVEADTADEVRSLLGLRKNASSGIDPAPAKRAYKRKKSTGTAKKTAKRKTAKKTAKKKSAKRKPAGGWDAARKAAKKQGRTDVAAVRAELAQANK